MNVAIQTSLKAWADNKTGIPFFMAGQHAKAPPLPYGTFDILTSPVSRFVERDEHTFADDALTFRLKNDGVMTVRFQTYSQSQSGNTSARAYLQRLIDSIGMPSSESLLGPGLVPHSGAGVGSVSTVLDNEVRGRALVDLRFNVRTEATEQVSWIETVEIDGSVDDTVEI